MYGSLVDKVKAYLIIRESRNNFPEAQRIFKEMYPDRPISSTCLMELFHKFETTETAYEAERIGGQKITDDKKIDITAEIVVDSTSFIAQVASSSIIIRSLVALTEFYFHG